MSKIEILKFEDVLFACRKFVDEPENDEYFKAVEEIKTKIVVKDYLSLHQKQDLIHIIFKHFMEYGDPGFDPSIALEVYIIMDGLLAYSNISRDISLAFKTVDVCDVLEFSGILECIRNSCNRDFSDLARLVSTQLSWDHIQELCEFTDAIDSERIDDLNRRFDNFTSKDNIEMLAKLERLLEFNDPTTLDRNDGLKRAFADFVKDENKNPQNDEEIKEEKE